MIFEALEPADGDDCLRAAVSAILNRAQNCGLGPGRACWSLTELGPDEADFVWLKAWAQQVRGTTLVPWLNSWQYHDAAKLTGAGSVGLLLLLLAAEAARREATEGILWPTVARQFAGDVHRLLFVNGQPTAEHKRALESTSWELGLRHVFGIDGLHNWVTSVYLQFGFTRRGFEANLPLWMTAPQSRSNALEDLLGGQLLHSASFQEMWSALSGFRRRNVTAARLETVLENSPWVLPEWRESLVRLTQTKMHLGGGLGANQTSQTEISQDFLDTPTLRWDGSRPPEFICHWQGLTELDLPDDAYTLILGGRETARLVRQPEGGFAAQPEGELFLPSLPSQAALLVNSENQMARTQILTCWDEADDVTAFRLPSGERVPDVWTTPLRPGSDYVFIVASDLSIAPDPARWQMTADGQWKFSFLSSSSLAKIQILTPEGECLWRPPQPVQTGSEWTAEIRLTVPNSAGPRHWGESVKVFAAHPADISVTFARCHGQTLACNAKDGGTWVGPLLLMPGTRTLIPELTLGLADGVVSTVRRLPLPFSNVVGALYHSQGQRCPLSSQTVLTTTRAQTESFQVFADTNWEAADPVLFEGDMAVGKPSARPSSLPALAGFGGRLSLRSRAYNDREDSLVVAQEVVNSGHILALMQEEGAEGREIQVHFARRIEPGKGHTVFWWGRDGVQRFLAVGEFRADSESGAWRFTAPNDWGKPQVIAVAFEGARLGTWWDDQWDKMLENPASALETAALVRWLRLPVLSARALRRVRMFAQSAPQDVMAAWLGDAGLPSGLEWGQSDERWPDAVRQIFADWRPGLSQARQILKTLAAFHRKAEADGDTTARLQHAARLLLRVDPHLAARILVVWLRDFLLPKTSRSETLKKRDELCHALAETTGHLDAHMARLFEEAVATMRCDDNFVKRGLLEKAVGGFQGQPLTEFDRTNITLALAVLPFRRLLAVRLLQQSCP